MKKLIVTCFAAFLFLAVAPHAGAVEYKINDYKRGGETIDVTLPRAEGGANATLTCVGNGGPSGGWTVSCKYPLCYYVYDKSEGKGKIVCDYPKETGKPPFDFDLCTPKAKDAEKRFCASDPRISGDTGDDMFSIRRGAGGFFEYRRIDKEDPQSLKWIARGTGGQPHDIMMPSGPGGSFADYRAFLNDPPPSIQVRKACYPGTATLCENPPEPKSGRCGPAHNGWYRNDPPIEARCEVGKSSNPVKNKDNWVWNWTCDPMFGGPVVECRAKVIADAECGAADGKTYHTVSEIVKAGQCKVGKPASSPQYDGSSGWNWKCDPPHHPDEKAGKRASCRAKQPPATKVVSSCLTIGISGTSLQKEDGVPLRTFPYNFAYGWNIPDRFNFTGAGQPGYGYVSHELHFWIDDVTKIEHMGLGEANWEDYMRIYIGNSAGSHHVWDSQWFNGKPWLESVDQNRLWTLPSGYYYPWKPYLRNGHNVLLLQNLTVGKGQMWVDVGFFCNPYK